MFSIPVRQVSDNLQILDEVARRPDGLLIARDGQIDLVGTSASDADIAPRVEAAKVAIEDLIEACARSNLHSSLHRFAERYRTELDRLHSGETGLTWYIVAQRIEMYRATYGTSSGRDPAEYPPLEPDFATLVDTVILANAMLAPVFPEISRSQDDIRKYAGEQ